MNEWHKIALSNIDSPALIIDKDKVRYNIQLAVMYAGGTKRLRPHVKTHKMLEIAKMQIAEGIHKFKCATIAEAEMLGMAEAKDVLIAYPVQGPKVNRVFALMKKFPKTQFSILIDNIDTIKFIDEKFKSFGKSIDVYIDVNVGHDRTGVAVDQAKSLVGSINQSARLKLMGLHCYDGHIHTPSFQERTKICRKVFEEVFLFRNQLQKELKKDIPIVAGGSPTFSVHAKHHDVECSPGTFVLWDEGYASQFQEQAFKKAAVIATRVISKINTYTYCLDLGHKSVASEFPLPRVAFIDPHEFTQIGHSEEHLVIKSSVADALYVGQILLAYPYHICPTVALYDQVYVASSGNIIDQWDVTARNRKITI